MKMHKIMWLEIILVVFIVMTLFVSIKNVNLNIQIKNTKRLSNSTSKIKVSSFEEYLKQIKELNNATIFFTVKDIQGYSLTQTMVDGLKKLGFENTDILLEHKYHSFIGIVSDGKVVYQNIGGDEAIGYIGNIDNHAVVVKSEMLQKGNKGIIYLDEVGYANDMRGINIVVLDNVTDSIIDSITFDTHDENIPAYRMVNGSIEKIAGRTVKE